MARILKEASYADCRFNCYVCGTEFVEELKNCDVDINEDIIFVGNHTKINHSVNTIKCTCPTCKVVIETTNDYIGNWCEYGGVMNNGVPIQNCKF